MTRKEEDNLNNCTKEPMRRVASDLTSDCGEIFDEMKCDTPKEEVEWKQRKIRIKNKKK